MKSKFIFYLLILSLSIFFTACSIKSPINNQYKLFSYSAHTLSKSPSANTILVNVPEAVAGYQTEQMLYMQKPYELSPFAHNAWIDPPADMMFPLIVQSLQASGYFAAVASAPSAEATHYRLDTQLLELQQTFLQKPSRLNFAAKIVLTDIVKNRVIASKIIRKSQPCPQDTPYGGVIAANQVMQQFTAELTQFALRHLAH